MVAVATRRVDVMGTSAHLVGMATDAAAAGSSLEGAVTRLDQLEGRWSRFRADSEISRLNQADGHPCVVSSDTADLVACGISGWAGTGGRFDPSVGIAIGAIGYRASRATSDPDRAVVVEPTGPAPGCAAIEVLPSVPLVRLPAGVAFDPGGFGKGRAADLVAAELVAGGLDGACVNVGGDLRVAGTSPHPGGWRIDLDPADAGSSSGGGGAAVRLALRDGGVATSTTSRRWRTDRGPRHHQIDPRVGDSVATDVATAVVVAGEAWRAEVLATAIVVAGAAAADEVVAAAPARQRVGALVVTTDGDHLHLGAIEDFLR